MSLEYREDVHYTTKEVGPITSDDLLSLIAGAPVSSETMYFNLRLLSNQEVLPNSSADIAINPNKGTMNLRKISVPLPHNNSEFSRILEGGRLRRLSLEYPGFRSEKSDFNLGSKALEIARDNLEFLLKAGYDLDSVCLGHYMVKVPGNHPGFFTKSYGALVHVKTHELIKDQPERKLVLSFTGDKKDSEEVKVYQKIFSSITSRSPVSV